MRKGKTMDVHAVWDGCKATLRVLYGSSAMPPLGRSAFIKEAAFVFLVRLLAVESVTSIWFWQIGIDSGRELEEYLGDGGPLLVSVLVACVFFVPYLRVMHRRFLGIGVSWPGIFVALIAAAVVLLTPYLPDDGLSLRASLISSGTCILPYILLLPWPDRMPKSAR